MKKLFRALSGCFAAAAVTIGLLAGAVGAALPDAYQVTSGSSFEVAAMGMPVQVQRQEGTEMVNGTADAVADGSYTAQLRLFDCIPVKTVQVNVVEETEVIPCGTPFGIKMFTNGVVVVGTSDLETEEGIVNPAIVAGIRTGDVILSIDGESVNQNEEVARIVEESGGEPLQLTVQRETKTFTATLQPVLPLGETAYKGGLWVRDSTAGIGTITFYDPQAQVFGGLGHGICDVDTRELLPMRSGEIVPVTIHDVVKGQSGAAGELRGYFTSDTASGFLLSNEETGVYGHMESSPVQQQAVPVAMKQEVRTGAAQILSTVSGDSPEYYDIEILSIDYQSGSAVKNMVIQVTDADLLEKTGGIVQGMSGSPILQNGKLVGAVTHVFLQDATQGYAIFAENMLSAAENLDDSVAKAS